ncbi:hypothetical protein HPB49_021269 [Dermacentor silvarum]|uniref:Uncharacterized protein n=1 Tax=Dermacentor silvarum TaxID=543639 RepID=A0ACB8CHK0_DERSI|nr:hypothetical protein HPB49_021269 [Dermacentor silvarum]
MADAGQSVVHGALPDLAIGAGGSPASLGCDNVCTANAGHVRIDFVLVTEERVQEVRAREQVTLQQLGSMPANARKIDNLSRQSDVEIVPMEPAALYPIVNLDVKTLLRYFDVSLATVKFSPTGISKANTAVQLGLVAATLAAPVFGFVDHGALHAFCDELPSADVAFDDLRAAGASIPAGITLEGFADADKDLELCAELTDDEIIRQVTEDSDDSDTENEEPAPTQPTNSELTRALMTLSSVYSGNMTLTEIEADMIAGKRTV